MCFEKPSIPELVFTLIAILTKADVDYAFFPAKLIVILFGFLVEFEPEVDSRFLLSMRIILWRTN